MIGLNGNKIKTETITVSGLNSVDFDRRVNNFLSKDNITVYDIRLNTNVVYNNNAYGHHTFFYTAFILYVEN